MEMVTLGRLNQRYIRRYIYAGNAVVTLLNPETKKQFTFRFHQKTDEDGRKTPYFVSLYEPKFGKFFHIAHVIPGEVYCKKESEKDESILALKWLMSHLDNTGNIEVWHNGRCGCCSKILKAPSELNCGLDLSCEMKIRKEERIG